MAHVVECVTSKLEDLSSNSSGAKKKKKERKKEKILELNETQLMRNLCTARVVKRKFCLQRNLKQISN
jgi:hypothetical protein